MEYFSSFKGDLYTSNNYIRIIFFALFLYDCGKFCVVQITTKFKYYKILVKMGKKMHVGGHQVNTIL